MQCGWDHWQRVARGEDVAASSAANPAQPSRPFSAGPGAAHGGPNAKPSQLLAERPRSARPARAARPARVAAALQAELAQATWGKRPQHTTHNHEAFRRPAEVSCGSRNKPLVPYHPGASRNRLPTSTQGIANAFASQLTFGSEDEPGRRGATCRPASAPGERPRSRRTSAAPDRAAARAPSGPPFPAHHERQTFSQLTFCRAAPRSRSSSRSSAQPPRRRPASAPAAAVAAAAATRGGRTRNFWGPPPPCFAARQAPRRGPAPRGQIHELHGRPLW